MKHIFMSCTVYIPPTNTFIILVIIGKMSIYYVFHFKESPRLKGLTKQTTMIHIDELLQKY